ncbi:hypothetical protein L211DRAFT_864621, partial [Terfezia boudieri ATCC MYA-4762]
MSSNQSEDSSGIQDATQVGSASIFQPDTWRPTQTAENHTGIDEDMTEEEFPLLKLAVSDRRDTPEQFITLYKGGHFLSHLLDTPERTRRVLCKATQTHIRNGDVGVLTIYIRQFEHETLEGDTWKKFVYLNRLDKPLPKAWNQLIMAPTLKGEVAGTNASYIRNQNW